MDENFEGVILRRIAKDVIRLDHLIKRKFVGHKFVGRNLVLGLELQLHPERVGVD